MKELLEALEKMQKEQNNKIKIDKESKEAMKGVIENEDQAIILATANSGQVIMGSGRNILSLLTMINRTLIHEYHADKEMLLKTIEYASLTEEELLQKGMELAKRDKETNEKIKEFLKELKEDIEE